MTEQTIETLSVNEWGEKIPSLKAPISKRIIICTPTTGLVRIEWVHARYHMTIPCNWSSADIMQLMDNYAPLNFMVADARNICVDLAVRHQYQWLLFIDHDTCPPPDTMIKMNQYMLDGRVPVVGGLYRAKGYPPEPLVYRGRGNGYYKDWKPGDMVWVDGLPMGCTLINVGLLAAMHDASPEYEVGGHKVRRVFHTPGEVGLDKDTGEWRTISGTEDLWWCTRVMQEGWLKKCGYDYVADREFPFLIDTSIDCKHINPDGRVF